MLTIEGLLTVLGYTFTVFALGYALGLTIIKNRNNRPMPRIAVIS